MVIIRGENASCGKGHEEEKDCRGSKNGPEGVKP